MMKRVGTEGERESSDKNESPRSEWGVGVDIAILNNN